MKKQTKIVCTIGPASEDKDTLLNMTLAGMDVCRLNFSHGTYEHHTKLINNIRDISQEHGIPLAIMADLQGPRIRTGQLPKEGIKVTTQKDVILTTATDDFRDEKIPITYKTLHQEIGVGERILINDALVGLEVKEVSGQDIICRVIQPGIITTRRGMNFPDSYLSIAPITEKDKEDLAFAIEHEVDYIALSFVSRAKDVYDLKYLVKDLTEKKHPGQTPIMIVAKIERKTAVDNIDEIIEAADAIMVARGDLGIELPPEDVPLHQKTIVDKCLIAAKPVIIATQMLDSMIRNPRPTRAEVSDVANAVIDHTDAVMLSGESATGAYPQESVATMAKIIATTEASEYDDVILQSILKDIPIDDAISQMANLLASSVKAQLILVASLSGYTARIVSRYRPQLPIFVTTDNQRVQRQLNLSWGVQPFILPTCKSIEELIDRSLGYLKHEQIVKKEDKIIIIAGEPVGRPGVNLVEIREVT